MKRPLFIVLAVTGMACRGGSDAPATVESQKTAAAAEAGHADPSLVNVDPSMLRDLRITTTAVESRGGAEDVALLGELAVDERAYAEVGVSIAARISRVLAGPGDAVLVGQALLELQSPEVGRARADFVSAEARLALAEEALTRKKSLAAERIVPLREVQEAEAAATEARSALRAATATLNAVGVSAPKGGDPAAPVDSSFILRSPISGTVIERAAMLGQMLDPAQPAFRISNLRTLWLTVHAFERDAVRIVRGASARISFAALPGETFPGTVSLVGSEVTKESRTVPVRINVQNRANRLRPGMSATASVPVGASQAAILTVPVAAVQRVRNEWCVFLPKSEGTFEIRKIGRGRDLGGEVEVLTGLKSGETIVVDGAFLLKAQAEKGQAGHGDHGGQP